MRFSDRKRHLQHRLCQICAPYCERGVPCVSRGKRGLLGPVTSQFTSQNCATPERAVPMSHVRWGCIDATDALAAVRADGNRFGGANMISLHDHLGRYQCNTGREISLAGTAGWRHQGAR